MDRPAKRDHRPYRVVFVEDEIVTRQGIRDNVDWQSEGYEFCGEASDGEIALQQIEATRPDVLITDIKMPFMDGLQLSKIVRERMPWVQIVILSGHDEFEYAQEAIKLGVKEYLLKPVTREDMHQMLQRLSVSLAQQKLEQEKMRKLQEQVEESQAALRERFLLKLVVGAVPSSEVIEKSQQLGLDLVARCYMVVILKTELADRSEQFDYDESQRIQKIVDNLASNDPDIFVLKKDWEEFALLMKGASPDFLQEERDLFLDQLQQEVSSTRYRLSIGTGGIKTRITHIYQSFIEALVTLQAKAGENRAAATNAVEKKELLKLNRSAVEHYLRCGEKEGFDEVFDTFILPQAEAALKSSLIKNYLLVDMILATVKFVDELGGDINQAVSDLNSIEKMQSAIKTIADLKEQVRKILVSALVFRDGLAGSQHGGIVRQVKEFVEANYKNPDLMLSDAAGQVNLSSSHLSMVFSQENGRTFKEYLTEVRITQAKGLLRSTNLSAAEISSQVGYSDPHYFSFVFKKNTGVSPTEFRNQVLGT